MKHDRLSSIALLGSALFLVAALLGAQQPDPDRYIVELEEGMAAPARAALRAAGAEILLELGPQNAVAARIPAAAVPGLARNPSIARIERDPPRYPMAEVTPYGIPMIQADQVDDSSAANRSVCIIDSGYYLDHEDLQDLGVTASSDSGTGDPFTDGCGHGTHVAGTVAAVANGLGVVGVLPGGKVNLHIVKVFGDDCAWAYSSTLIQAANACKDAGADVISMSLGCSGGPGSGPFACRNSTEEKAFDDLYAAGILSVAAAGNDGSSNKSYPASYDSVISVAALDANKLVADFSQKNDQVELAAPGVSVLSSVPWIDENTLTAGSTTWSGHHIQFSARTGATGDSGTLVDGGKCTSTGAWAGSVVLCQRGDVSFFDKVSNVEQSGGVAAVVYNNEASDPGCGDFLGTLGDGNSSAIPAISLSCQEGAEALAAAGSPGTVVSQIEKPASGYEAWSGTSMATPHVSGAAALVWSHNTGWSNAQIRDALASTAEDLGAQGRDDAYGWGLVQAKAALDHLTGGSSCTVTESSETSCSDGLDNDCDGLVDGDDPDCEPACTVTESPETSCSDGLDNDCDGFVDADDSDCTVTSCDLLPVGAGCSSDSECCSNKCRGRPGGKTCK